LTRQPTTSQPSASCEHNAETFWPPHPPIHCCRI
jgi:hypothetical protein